MCSYATDCRHNSLIRMKEVERHWRVSWAPEMMRDVGWLIGSAAYYEAQDKTRPRRDSSLTGLHCLAITVALREISRTPIWFSSSDKCSAKVKRIKTDNLCLRFVSAGGQVTVETGKGVTGEKGKGRGGSLRGGMQMHLSGESLASWMDGKVAVWTQRRATWRSNLEGWLIKKGFGVQIQSLKGERSLVLARWLAGWESWYLPSYQPLLAQS